VLSVALVMASMVVTMAVPAFAASTKGNCIGTSTSQFAEHSAGANGDATSSPAAHGGNKWIAPAASTNCGQR